MTNHYHAVFQIDEKLSAGMQELNGRFATISNWVNKRRDHLFGRRFTSHLIEDDAYLLESVRYVLLNPVRSAGVARPEHWRCSSARAMLGSDPAPAWLDVEFVLGYFGATPEPARRRFSDFVLEGIGDFVQGEADTALVALTKAIRRSSHLLIAEGEASIWNSSWPLLSEIKNARSGLLLQPETLDGELILKTPFPRIQRSEFPPGRGMFAARNQVARVQLPLVDPSDPAYGSDGEPSPSPPETTADTVGTTNDDSIYGKPLWT